MSWPKRGDVWVTDLGLAAKVRPALVLSVPVGDDERALLTLVPHTTSRRGTRFEIETSARFLRAGAFDAQGPVTVPRVRLLHRLGSLPSPELRRVEAAVALWLGLELRTE